MSIPEDNQKEISRRELLKVGVAAFAAGPYIASCASQSEGGLASPTPEQKSHMSQDKPTVLVKKVPNYTDNIFEHLKPYLQSMPLPDIKGKSVVVKINMVDFRSKKPLTTDPAMLPVAAAILSELGASNIIIADGPAISRDTEYVLEATGIGAMCKKLSLKFVDLNRDDLTEVENKMGFSGEKSFFLPNTVLNAGAIMTLPKLKTHHWTKMTCCMKNLFGVIPGRKYGWPKNLLHVKGIERCVVDINSMIRPSLCLVDGIIAMEGDGPLNGTPREMGIVALGTCPVATDAVCAKLMDVEPDSVKYLKLASQVLGKIDLTQIDLLGDKLSNLVQSFEMAPTFSRSGKNYPAALLQKEIEEGGT